MFRPLSTLVSSSRAARALPLRTECFGAAPARGFLTLVHQGYQGYRTTLGRNPVLIEPGLAISIPIVHQLQKVDMRECSVNLEGSRGLSAYTSDNVPVGTFVSVFFRVTDAYKACFEVSDYRSAIETVGTSAVRSIIGTLDYDTIIGDRNKINALLTQVIGDSIDRWGIQCTRAEIQQFGPLNHNVEAQLEKQMSAERDRRQQLLNTQAKVNVADGERQSMVLLSEGELQSSENKARAHLAIEQRKADARRYALEQETSALAAQLQAIKRELDGDAAQASAYLLAQARVKELQAIAAGTNNSVYFLGAESAAASGTVRDAKLLADAAATFLQQLDAPNRSAQ